MSRSGPAVQDETRQALDNFLGPGVAVQSMESLRKELSISSRSSLLSDILNEPKIRESVSTCFAYPISYMLRSFDWPMLLPVVCSRSTD